MSISSSVPGAPAASENETRTPPREGLGRSRIARAAGDAGGTSTRPSSRDRNVANTSGSPRRPSAQATWIPRELPQAPRYEPWLETDGFATEVHAVGASLIGPSDVQVPPPSSERDRWTLETPPQVEGGASRQSYHITYGRPKSPTMISGIQSSYPTGSSVTRHAGLHDRPSSEPLANTSR